jgi:hypothetical protein
MRPYTPQDVLNDVHVCREDLAILWRRIVAARKRAAELVAETRQERSRSRHLRMFRRPFPGTHN